MKRSTNRILTTHVGSLIRPPKCLILYARGKRGRAVDERRMTNSSTDSVAEVVRDRLRLAST